jgi:hypothetical protein
MTADEFASLALSLPGTAEGAHMGKRDFRVLGGAIFASLPAPGFANLKLTPDQQQLMTTMHADLFAPLANAWGRQGWTALTLAACPVELALTALLRARDNAAPRARKSRKGA